MKYLEVPALDAINKALSFDTTECKVVGRVEAYSCKSAGADKKVYKYLENKYLDEMAHSTSPEDHFKNIVSPFGPMNEANSRKTLFYLIATLNAAYPDHDFTDVKPDHFSKQPSVALVTNSVTNTLFNLGHEQIVRDMRIWEVVDETINLEESDVYSYNNNDLDPNSDGAIWSQNFIFFNKKLKRIVFFTLRGMRHGVIAQDDIPAMESENEDYVVGDIEV
ncbi:uncharacterized protein VTP21DRAFT_5170 [Calcarisporiella thermophila]|uniref:uncharacterized protein n=1 Tax=Calcarisporiella thermophila TaxID=911321 RepID=UPI003742BC82